MRRWPLSLHLLSIEAKSFVHLLHELLFYHFLGSLFAAQMERHAGSEVPTERKGDAYVVWEKAQWRSHEILGVYKTKELAIKAQGPTLMMQDDRYHDSLNGGSREVYCTLVEAVGDTCWFGMTEEHGGGQSYHHDVNTNVFDSEEAAVSFINDYFDTEHNREERECEECECEAFGCGEACPCRIDMNDQFPGETMVSVSCYEGTTVKVWELPVLSEEDKDVGEIVGSKRRAEQSEDAKENSKEDEDQAAVSREQKRQKVVPREEEGPSSEEEGETQ